VTNRIDCFSDINTAKEIETFGEQYDPQPFLIGEVAGRNSFFSGLIASKWLTVAIAMRFWSNPSMLAEE
jgi:acyl dehydratase